MSWTDIFIHRPVLAIVLSITILLAGLLGLCKLPLRLFPKVETPVITITVNSPGLSARAIQGYMTNRIESALTGIRGVNYITSATSQGRLNIAIHMHVGAKMDASMTEIMQKMASIKAQLPSSIQEPMISKAEANDNPLLLLAITSDVLSDGQMYDYLQRIVKPQLESVKGVADAEISGSQYAMRLWLNSSAMLEYHVAMADVVASLKKQNRLGAVGSLAGNTQTFIDIKSTMNDAKSFNHLVVKRSDHEVIHLSDIGSAKLANESEQVKAFYQGQHAGLIFIHPVTGANPLAVISAVEKVISAIKRRLPDALKFHVVVNAKTYINSSIIDVLNDLVKSILVVILVIFLFLGTWRTALIPIITIPLALIGVCFILMLLGYSLNLLTLLAMVIAIGLVVDDAIVIMENIHRYQENGRSRLHAALQGTREVSSSVIIMTFSLAAIYAPLIFSGGVTGKLFIEFAVTLSVSVIISGVIALTLSPLMCERIMPISTTHSRLVNKINSIFSLVKQFYLVLLRIAFKHKKPIITIWLFALIAIAYIYLDIPKELLPKEDEGLIQVVASAPDSTNSQYLSRYTKQLNLIYQKIAQIQSYIYINGVPTDHSVLSFVRLTPSQQRIVSSFELKRKLQRKLNQISGLQATALVPSVLPGTSGFPVEFVLTSFSGYLNLYRASIQLEQLARKSGIFQWINDDLNYDQPVAKLAIDRKAATAMGIDIDDLTQTLEVALNDNYVQHFNLLGQAYKIIPQIDQVDRSNPEQILNLTVPAKHNTFVPLSALLSMKIQTEPTILRHFQKQNAVTLSGVLAYGHSLSEALDFLQSAAKKLLASNIHYDFSGNSRQFLQEGHRMLWTFCAAFIVIFLLLSVQFNSFRDPCIILLGTLPMTLLAAMIPLWLGFATINLYTQVGLLTLAGLITKHGILLVKFANAKKDQGCRKLQAMLLSAEVRLRPVLMTTFAIVFGSLPLVFATGTGSICRFNLGIVITVGMIFGTLFTLLVLPILYVYLSGDQ